jgi:hypothetical protein
VISEDAGRRLAEFLGASFIEVSAKKEIDGVKEAFAMAVRKVWAALGQHQNVRPQRAKKSGCLIQ